MSSSNLYTYNSRVTKTERFKFEWQKSSPFIVWESPRFSSSRGQDRAQQYDDAVHEMPGRDQYMALYFGGVLKDKVTSRLWSFNIRNSLDNRNVSYVISSLFGSNYLHDNFGHLFGVAPEALGAKKSVVGATLDDFLALSKQVPDMTPAQLKAYETAVRAQYAMK